MSGTLLFERVRAFPSAPTKFNLNPRVRNRKSLLSRARSAGVKRASAGRARNTGRSIVARYGNDNARRVSRFAKHARTKTDSNSVSPVEFPRVMGEHFLGLNDVALLDYRGVQLSGISMLKG